MSYIEKEKAIENVSQIRLEVVGARAVGKTIFTEALRIYRDAVLKSLNEAPPSDVVAVVRCRDCKHFVDEDETDMLGLCTCKRIAIAHNAELYPERDFYCPYGERREE